MQFQTYDVVLRIGGALTTEILKSGVLAPEVSLLRAIHGEDSIPRAKHVGSVALTNEEARTRLDRDYGRKSTIKLFGDHEGGRLPTHASKLAEALASGIGGVDIEALRNQIRAEVLAELDPDRALPSPFASRAVSLREPEPTDPNGIEQFLDAGLPDSAGPDLAEGED